MKLIFGTSFNKNVFQKKYDGFQRFIWGKPGKIDTIKCKLKFKKKIVVNGSLIYWC